MKSDPATAPAATRLLVWISWFGLSAAVLVASSALFCQWAVNAGRFGARDAGLAIIFAFVGAVALSVSLYAAPALSLLGGLSLFVQRRAGLRLIAASAIFAAPLVILPW
jgi:hypothetical protein